MMLKIAVLPIGQVNVDALDFIQCGLKEHFFEAEAYLIQPSMPMPSEAYSSSRRQYHSTLLLAQMRTHFGNLEPQYILGVTEVDLYAAGLNFVFGEAQCPGKFAIISLLRLKPEFYGEICDNSLFLARAVKEAVHEVGHVIGLGHCSNPMCVMYFSNSIEDTDRKQVKFCDDCHLLVHRILEK
jgi:archaemetzincin